MIGVGRLEAIFGGRVRDWGQLSENEYGSRLSNYGLGLTSTRSDGLSVSVIQAMASGCLVLAPNSPSNSEIIRDRVNSFLYELDNLDSFSETLFHALSMGRERLMQIRTDAVATIKERFSTRLSEDQLRNMFLIQTAQ